MDQIQNATEKQKDLLSYLFDNSITSMLLSTFVIAIVGVLITKLRSFKKKLDMIEILTRAQVKMKKQAEDRETRIELKFKELDGKIERNWIEMDKKIDDVDKHAMDILLKYMSESSFDRKR